MTQSSVDLCSQLSYHDQNVTLRCRGPAKLLMDDLENCAGDNPELGSHSLAMRYLLGSPFGLRHTGNTSLAPEQYNVLNWEEPRSKAR